MKDNLFLLLFLGIVLWFSLLLLAGCKSSKHNDLERVYTDIYVMDRDTKKVVEGIPINIQQTKDWHVVNTWDKERQTDKDGKIYIKLIKDYVYRVTVRYGEWQKYVSYWSVESSSNEFTAGGKDTAFIFWVHIRDDTPMEKLTERVDSNTNRIEKLEKNSKGKK